MEQNFKFLVYRKAVNEDLPRYEKYEVPEKEGMSILDALFYIQDHFDSTFAFRYSCRGAICGSCSITVDKNPQLACRTQVASVKTQKKPLKLPDFDFGDVSAWDRDNEILIEPLPNMKVIKDLIVDMEPFWKFYRDVKPFFAREWNDVAPESIQTPENAKILERLVYCILCGTCWSCPVNKKNPNYLGPAALAKSHRFIIDTRLSERDRKSIITEVLRTDGVPSCERHFVCNRVCPKDVRPGTSIKKISDQFSI